MHAMPVVLQALLQKLGLAGLLNQAAQVGHLAAAVILWFDPLMQHISAGSQSPYVNRSPDHTRSAGGAKLVQRSAPCQQQHSPNTGTL